MLKISIEYCRPWSYTARAVSLFDDLLGGKALEAQIESVDLIPSSGGRYEITVNVELIYSKNALKRHAETGEEYKLVKARAGWSTEYLLLKRLKIHR